MLFFLHDYTKSGDEDETEQLQYAVAAFCFLGVGPSQVRQFFFLLFCHFKFRVKVCFLNAISADGGGF